MDPVIVSMLPAKVFKLYYIERAKDFEVTLTITRLDEGRDVDPVYGHPEEEYRKRFGGNPALTVAATDVACAAAQYQGPQCRQSRGRPRGVVYAVECKLIADESGEPRLVYEHDVCYLTPEEMAFSLVEGVMPQCMLLPRTPDVQAERRFAATKRGPAWTVRELSSFEWLFSQACADFAAVRQRAKQRTTFMLCSRSSGLPKDAVRQIVELL